MRVAKKVQQIKQKGLFGRSLEFFQKINAFWASVLGIVAIVGSIWSAWRWLMPSISITAGTVASNIAPLEAEYTLKNNGNINLYDVILGCEISSAKGSVLIQGNVINIPGLSMSQYVPLLVPGGVASRNCGGNPMTNSPGLTYPATIVWASAKWPWPYPFRTYLASETFKSIKDSDGHIQISPDTH